MQEVAGTETQASRGVVSLWQRAARRDESALAVISLVVMVSGAVVSDSDALSSALVAVGGLVGAAPVWRARDDRIARLAISIALVWLVYGLIVGSLPSLTSPGSVRSWATTEGRVLVSLAAMAIARGVTRVDDVRAVGRGLVGAVTILHSPALVLFVVGWSAPGFRIEAGGLFRGLSSSHHVVGFVAAGAIVIVLAAPSWFRRWEQVAAVLVALVSIAAAGSRTSLLGLMVAGLMIAAVRVDRRRLVMALVAFVAVSAVVVAVTPRFRQTVEIMTRSEFPSEVAEAWSRGTTVGIRDLSDSPAEANILSRIALWGGAWDSFVDSPLIGIGAFRQNDAQRAFSGVRHVVWVATAGVDRFDDSEPHNVVLFLLEETGLVGLALFAAPYVLAWRATRRSSPDDDAEIQLLCRATILMALGISMVSSGLLATGLGLIANAVIFTACPPLPSAPTREEAAT